MECKCCNQIKSIPEFHKNTKTKSGYNAYCKPCRKAYDANRRLDNPGRTAKINAMKRSKRPQYRAVDQARYQRQIEDIKERVAGWKKANPHKTRAYSAKRKAQKLQATPEWANQAYIALWYELAKQDEELLGVKCHVDHIIPLVHPLVCGLHNEHNLQVLTESENCSKQNKFKTDWED